MGVDKPFHRNYRQMIDGYNSGYSDWAYIVDREYAKNPEHYTRAFSIIQSDLLKLFEFIEPAEINNNTYSFRIHELFMRVCIEVEANFKAILRENIFNPKYKSGQKQGQYRAENTWNINDFKIINKTHHLDDYSVEMPFWTGQGHIITPFHEWKSNTPLTWYQAYNLSKHDRLDNFHLSNFRNLITGFAGLFVLLSSQFNTESFSTGGGGLGTTTNSYFNSKFGLGGYLMIKFPTNWNDSEKYEFNWADLQNQPDRFNKIDYDIL